VTPEVLEVAFAVERLVEGLDEPQGVLVFLEAEEDLE
jgi:hypothetical protein